ncbi:hypothetical protein L596_020408 [Steinernema carpocapsae]|uniref:Uncharacterized protein n=1 Tax=Steinernema carpocapsae TaxID=34508 RepID=A0A4U5MU45_STECR|nr:hypothetical protein L596_020408 [Steinernema carpocapsae]
MFSIDLRPKIRRRSPNLYISLSSKYLILKKPKSDQGMEFYLFRHDEYLRLYNCSAKTHKEWNQIFPSNYLFGLFCIVTGTLYTVGLSS